MKYPYVVMFSDENIVLGMCPESIEAVILFPPAYEELEKKLLCIVLV